MKDNSSAANENRIVGRNNPDSSKSKLITRNLKAIDGTKDKTSFFGTDGIRGKVNEWPMTAEQAMRVGQAAGTYFKQASKKKNVVVIGKDTRLSGYMFESALVAGFTSVGVDVHMLGPLPTPAVAMMTRSLRADMGVMITASHNAYKDNGIKLFGPDGNKLSDMAEKDIETLLRAPSSSRLAPHSAIGRAFRVEEAQSRYVEIVKSTLPRGMRLDQLRIVIDCANGAAHKVAPKVLWELGADIIPLGVEPDGFNINDNVGSNYPTKLASEVIRYRADLGIALDGDADRVILVDQNGEVIGGDQILAALAWKWKNSKRLLGNAVVATIMSNLGLERYVESLGLKLVRTAVGDRNVIAKMREGGYNLGGEQSGHVVLSDFASTGDGLVAALQILAVMIEEDLSASELLARFSPVPQLSRNIHYNDVNPLECPNLQRFIKDAQDSLLDKGRLVVRKSGTEPLVRIMVEGDDQLFLSRLLEEVCQDIEREM